MSVIGTNTSFTTTEDSRKFGLLQLAKDRGRELLYVQANGAVTATSFVVIDEDGQAAAASTTTTASAYGQKVGVAEVAFADNDFGWVVVSGTVEGNIGASYTPGTAPNSTSTGGRLDDDGTTGAETIEGVHVSEAPTSNVSTVILTNPTVGATIA